jgi:hypothetical protein
MRIPCACARNQNQMRRARAQSTACEAVGHTGVIVGVLSILPAVRLAGWGVNPTGIFSVSFQFYRMRRLLHRSTECPQRVALA